MPQIYASGIVADGFKWIDGTGLIFEDGWMTELTAALKTALKLSSSAVEIENLEYYSPAKRYVRTLWTWVSNFSVPFSIYILAYWST